jgi:eukaryotic-like serine/threonine-protein kinase
VHCVTRSTGKSLWSFQTRGKVDSSPVICRDKVAVGSDDGHLYLILLDQGTEVWSYDLGQPVGSSPAIAAGRLVIGCDDGNVYCFGAK